ncbi:MAG: hypothetical protein AAF902_09550 [Chloroflexota bacterium]
MNTLTISNPHLITYTSNLLTIDLLGGVDIKHYERLICTLRIRHAAQPMHRTTVDLYHDAQVDKLLHSLCEKWTLKLLDVSKTLQDFIFKIEEYRLAQQHQAAPQKTTFTISKDEQKQAKSLLKSKTLITQVIKLLNTTGIIGEDDNALILFLALASHKFYHPFSVLCLAKSGIGKSYILQKLAECLPLDSYSFHTQISANALYYFPSSEIDGKALMIEDLEWTTQMLQPLATLQTQGKLIKTRATKDKDGMLHSTTFEVAGRLCLIACAYSDKNYESLSLPFLMIHLNHSQQQDVAVMDYQKQVKAGLIAVDQVSQAQRTLKCLIASLEAVNVVNPYAPLISLPADIAHPRKSLLLLLNFIEVVTGFFQHQRTPHPDAHGELFIETHPDDIKLAFDLLKHSLFRRADELSTTTRGFYGWLQPFLEAAKTDQFTALDIRLAKSIHPRTLNRYLQELKLYGYIKVVGGNKHREGYSYKITSLGDHADVQHRIEKALQDNLTLIYR